MTFVVAIGIISGFGVAGALCMLKAQTVTARSRRKFDGSGEEAGSGWHLDLKPWYPLYLRCVGLLLWVADVVVFYLAFFPEAAR